jgi:hypothetical protein
METIINSGLKAFTCGAAALALTAIFSWSFVESTSVARWSANEASTQVGVSATALVSHAAKSTAAALVD